MSLTPSATPQSPLQTPPPPPPKTREELPPTIHPGSSSSVAPYHSHSTQLPSSSSTPYQAPPAPPRPPSHPALTYDVQRGQSSLPVSGTPTFPAELGSDDAAASIYAAGRRQGSIDHAATSQLPQPPPHPQQQQQQQQQHYAQGQRHDRDIPSMPPDGWLPEIVKNKSKPDLEKLLQTPSLLAGLLHHPDSQPAILEHSNSALREQLEATSQLAQHVSNQSRQVQEERARTQALLLRTRGAEQTFRTRQHAHEDAIEAFSPRALHRRLAQATREGEDELRVVQDSFLNAQGIASERDVQEWLRSMRRAREVVELRKERGERWAEGRVGGWR